MSSLLFHFAACCEVPGVEQVDPAYLGKHPLPALLHVPSVVARNLVSTAAWTAYRELGVPT